ncbi:MAG TPA: ATP-grasp domain-containing protein [Bacillota bacterium]
MRLSEFRGKKVLRDAGLRAPNGATATTPVEARRAAADLGGKAVVKAMIPVGGRGKAGLVKLVSSPADAEAAAAFILGQVHGGHTVTTLLVEEQVRVKNEHYLSIILDSSRRGPVLIFSPEGGMDIEQVAVEKPDRLVKVEVDPVTGAIARDFSVRLAGLALPTAVLTEVERFAIQLARIYVQYDLLLAEVNPLVVDADDQVIAADCKLEIDDSSLFRHQEFQSEAEGTLSAMEKEVKGLGGTLISLPDGEVGVICNGAGMGMAMLDMLKSVGLRPSNFLDTGGGIRYQRMKGITTVLLREKDFRGVVINLWGGIALLDEVAQAIIDVRDEYRPPYPLVVKLVGNNQEKARGLLEKAGITVAKVVETEKAVQMLAEVIEGRATDGRTANA